MRKSKEARLRILIVDDHPLFGDGLAALIQGTRPEVRIDRADSCETAIGLAAVDDHADGPIDFVFLDLNLRDTTGIASLRCVRERMPSVPIVVISADESVALMRDCINAGAMGYVPKTYPREQLIRAVQSILSGRIFLPDEVIGLADADVSSEDAKILRLRDLDLTPRQIEVFGAIVQGKPNKIIARELGVSESTIKKHVSPVLKALGVTDRLQAIIVLSRRGIRIE